MTLLAEAVGEDDSVQAMLRMYRIYRQGLYGFGYDASEVDKWANKLRQAGITDNLEDELAKLEEEISRLAVPEKVGNTHDSESTVSSLSWKSHKSTPTISSGGISAESPKSSTTERYSRSSTIPQAIIEESSEDSSSDESSYGTANEAFIDKANEGPPEHVRHPQTNKDSKPTLFPPGQQPDQTRMPTPVVTETPRSSQNSISSNQHTRTKPCSECGQQRPQSEFTASQWKKKVGAGRCVMCVSKTVQWQTGGMTAESLQKKRCSSCEQDKSFDQYSSNQWRQRIGTGRCLACVGST